MSLRAIKTVAFANGSACQFRPWLLFEDCAAALQDEDNLAAVIVGVHSDSGTWDEPPLEYAVGAVEEHVGGELLFASLELRKDRKVHAFEIYDHCLYVYVGMQR